MDSAQIDNQEDDEAKIYVRDQLSLRQLLEKIEKLDLSKNIRKEIASVATNSALSQIILYNEKIGDVGAAAIGEGLSKNDTLRFLSLNTNNIGDTGAAAIGKGFSKNASLTTLSLGNNNIGDVGAVAIGEGLINNTTLETLELDGNNIGDVGAVAIGEGLRSTRLITLRINGNNIKQRGFLALAKGFRLNIYLPSLNADPKGTEYLQPTTMSEIGRGAFGSVSLASTTNCPEVVEKKSLDGSKREETYEKLILQGLPEHKNVVRLAGISWNSSLLLEAHKGGSLKEYSRKHEGGVPFSQFLNYSCDMSLAIEHLHKHGIVHRDIAQRNYVLTEDLKRAVLVDFGLSWPIDEEKFVEIRPGELMPFRQCAPEVMTTMRYSKASDIWQLGLSYWQFLHRGRQPFAHCSTGPKLVKYLNKKMAEGKGHIPLSFKKNGAKPQLIQGVKALVVFCCAYNPEERPTATQVVERIGALRVPSAAEVKPDEEKRSEYQPDESVVVSGLKGYNYTDYKSLGTGGRSDYIDLNNDLEEQEEEGDDGGQYEEIEPLGEYDEI